MSIEKSHKTEMLQKSKSFTYKQNNVRDRYRGKTASLYDKKRQKRKKWKLELNAIEQIVSNFEPTDSILDIPLGTGRFLPIYKQNSHKVLGVDISWDMLMEAQKKCEDDEVSLINGDAVNIALKDHCVDYVVCIRLINWVAFETMQQILKEFRRIGRKGIVIGFRFKKPMNVGEFFKLGAYHLLPTPTNITRAAKKIKNFTLKARGKLKYEIHKSKSALSQKTGEAGATPNATTHDKKEEKSLYVQTLYNREDVLAFFSELGTEIKEEIHIDTGSDFLKGWAKPYSIFYLQFK